jgi:tripartite ATP-independent transporter DctM subunit
MGALALGVGYTIFGGAIVEVIYARLWGMLTEFILLAIPLFIFMGLMMERSGIADKLYEALYVCLGGVRGGLAISTIILGTILAATVGVIAASIAMLTLVSLPSMVKRGYDKSLATGVICAASGLGILIPPSIMLIVYGPMAGVSVGRLFFGAIIPGLILSALYISYVAIRCLLHRDVGPAVPIAERQVPFIKKTIMLASALVPPVILIGAVLGVIFLGIAPPTEAAAMGALCATLLAIAHRRFSFKVLAETALGTLKSSGLIFLLMAMAVTFAAVFIAGGGGHVVEGIILGIPGGRWGAFAGIMLVLFVLGKFIDWIGILFLTVPIIAPVVAEMGFDPLWFGIMVCVNLQTSLLTPPFAYAIFYLRAMAAPELGITSANIMWGIVPFVGLIIIALAFLIAFPEAILWLPDLMI